MLARCVQNITNYMRVRLKDSQGPPADHMQGTEGLTSPQLIRILIEELVTSGPESKGRGPAHYSMCIHTHTKEEILVAPVRPLHQHRAALLVLPLLPSEYK